MAKTDAADKTAGPADGKAGPGHYTTWMKVEIHHYAAQRLFTGWVSKANSKHTVIGLEQFSLLCGRVWGVAEARRIIEDKLGYTERRMEHLHRQNAEARERLRGGVGVDSHGSASPQVWRLRSETPGSGRGLQLLKSFDDLLGDHLLLYRLGIYSAEERSRRDELATGYMRKAYASGFTALAASGLRGGSLKSKSRTESESKTESETGAGTGPASGEQPGVDAAAER